MHVTQPVEYLPHVVLDLIHRDLALLLLSLLEDVLHTAIAKLHYSVLDDPLLRVNRVVEVQQLHNIRSTLQSFEDLVLS